MVTFRDLARPTFVPGQSAAARQRLPELDNSPRSMVERRNFPIDNTLLLQRFLKLSGGNRNNFIAARQQFASFFASFSAFHAIFSPAAVPIEPFVLFEHRNSLCMPGFLEARGAILSVPLTPLVRTFLPEYVLKGTFAGTWHIIMNTLYKHYETVHILIGTLLPKGLPVRRLQQPMYRIEAMALHTGEDTDKVDEPFQFALFDHLIECAGNVFQAQQSRIDWI
jgi:hypothetical protein